jgi:hypothetical protein
LLTNPRVFNNWQKKEKAMEKKDPSRLKILFNTGLPRTFRASNIAYLYEIAQIYPVILLSEKLDSETEKILQSKELFPKLEEVIPYRQFTGEKVSLFSPLNNYHYYKLAKSIIKKHKPDILVVGDMYLFQLYLVRFAKKKKSVIYVNIQGGFTMASQEKENLWRTLVSIYTKTPSFLPFQIRLFIVKCKRYLAHFIYYWILPLTVGEPPFIRKSSIFLSETASRLRSCDYLLLYSKRDCDLSGVPAEKLYILKHPLERKLTRDFFKKIYFQNSIRKRKINSKILTLMLPDDSIGFKRENSFLISKKETQRTWFEIITSINQILEGWKIFVKPHPAIGNFFEINQLFESISDSVKVVDPLDSADKYIEISDVIVGVPPASTTIFTASLQSPEKIILSLDFNKEILGDVYKDFAGVEYIDDNNKFIGILKEIRDNKYRKRKPSKKLNLEPNEFLSFAEAMEYFFRRKSIKI